LISLLSPGKAPLDLAGASRIHIVVRSPYSRTTKLTFPCSRDQLPGHTRGNITEAFEAVFRLAIFGLGCLLVLMIGIAKAHEARTVAGQPLGWTYGYECCSAVDCSVTGDRDISETPEGYRIEITGEIIPYGDKRIKRSRDEFFHRCTPGGVATAPRSICLYVPNRGF